MTFRGVLLQLVEGESASGFQVVAPDVELELSHKPMSSYATLLSHWSQQKLVVTDAISRKLLEVTRLATVTLQPTEKSILWGVTVPFGSKEARRGTTWSLTGYTDASKAFKPRHELSRRKSSAVASTSLNEEAKACQELLSLRRNGEAKVVTRRCYCFHFRSEFEYELFAHTLAAFTRMQQYTLVQSSVVMEMEISQEQKKRRAEEDVRLQAAANRAQQRLERLQTKKKEEQEKKKKKEKKEKPTKEKAKAKIVIAIPDKMICALCRIQRKPDAPEYPKHPFVLKDGKGEVVHICKVCLQRVLKQRVGMQTSAKKGSHDNMCGLCARSMEKVSAKSVKACAHKVCPRVYCLSCIDKLMGKARAHKVWRTKNWLCPNCSIDDCSAPAGERGNDAGSLSVKAALAPKQKKRKRCKEIEEKCTADEDGLQEAPIPASSVSEMKLIDYAATYFKFLLKREITDGFKESEDVCFCCKDGGDLIECDWKGVGDDAFERCPKVYHEDCLGYKVPEAKTWVCPRHRCQDCGIIAQYSCRFCVTSYCKVYKLCNGHLPKDIKRLGHATKDIPTSTYVMCPRCNHQAQDAFNQKKVGSDIYSKLFRRRAGKRS